jgi:hypothetical protein
MAIEKTITSPYDDSITLSYHKIVQLHINAIGKFVEITVGSFYDKDAYDADKQSGKYHTFTFAFADLSVADRQKLLDFEDVLEDIIITEVTNNRGETNELESGTKVV